MKKINSEGKVTYYYYKKKRGRHKKRGPKKKKILLKRGPKKGFDFKIVTFRFKKEDELIGIFRDLQEVEQAREFLINENKKVLFPIKFINNGRNSNKVYEELNEYVILKRNREEIKDTTSHLRDQYGRFIPTKTTNDKWIIYDKFPCLKEESFWVSGHNPKTARKDFQWIMDNFINDVFDNTDVVQIFVFKNKVIFRYDMEDLNFVVCKNNSDAIRMYNLLEDKYKKNKRVIFTGMVHSRSDRFKYIIELLQEKTGWSVEKICRNSTRH